MSTENQIEMVKLITGINQIDARLVAFYLTAAENFIFSYCGIQHLPIQLQQVKAQIAAKMITENTTIQEDGQQVGTIGKATGVITSMSDGNQSIGMTQHKGMTASFTYDQSSIIEAFGSILNRYRVLQAGAPTAHKGVRREDEYRNELDHYSTPNVLRTNKHKF